MLTTPSGAHDGFAVDGTILGATVRWQAVPTTLPGGQRMPRAQGASMVLTDDAVLYEDDLVRMLIRGTDEVWIEPRPGWRRAEVAHYVYGFGARVLLLHSGRFAIHASAVQLQGSVVVLGGDSGAGKSTTSVALANRGGRLLIDDVAPLHPQDGRVLLTPFDRPLHLLPDSERRVDTSGLHPLPPTGASGPAGKAALSFAVDQPDGALPVTRLAVLTVDEDAAEPLVVRHVTGAERLQWIVRLSNAVGVASYGSRSASFFAWATAVSHALPMLEIRRAPGAETLAGVVDAIVGEDG